MSSKHVCRPSKVLLYGKFKERRYEIDQCEACGAIFLNTGSVSEPHQLLIVPPTDPEFDEVLNHFQSMIEATRKTKNDWL